MFTCNLLILWLIFQRFLVWSLPPASGPTRTLTLVHHKPFHFPASWANPAFSPWIPPGWEAVGHSQGEATPKGSCPHPPSAPGRPQPQTLHHLTDFGSGCTKELQRAGEIPQHPQVRGWEALPTPQWGTPSFQGSAGRTQGMIPPQIPYPSFHPSPTGRDTNEELVNKINERGRPVLI